MEVGSLVDGCICFHKYGGKSHYFIVRGWLNENYVTVCFDWYLCILSFDMHHIGIRI